MINPKVEFLTGQAGTGKTYTIRERIIEHASGRPYGTLAATTGIAAVNLGAGVTTVNSALGYFDTASLAENYQKGKLHKRLAKLAGLGQNIVIDEVSMMNAEQLDIIYLALKEVNSYAEVMKRGGLGLVLTGDFCQLPPVEGDLAFKANCWNEFGESITRLSKVWRQDNLEFLEGLNAARQGDGDKLAEILFGLSSDDNIIFHTATDSNFDGTTIYSRNTDVDRHNGVRYLKLLSSGKTEMSFNSWRWGTPRGEWKLIPEECRVCEGAYVMILSNNPPTYDYANGDCGEVVGGNCTPLDSKCPQTCIIRLKRNSQVIQLRMIMRRNLQKERPEGCTQEIRKDVLGRKEFLAKTTQYVDPSQIESFDGDLEYARYLKGITIEERGGNFTSPYYDYEEDKWCIGEIRYMPLRLAYACTVHKTQGLTLDAVQIDPYNKFFGEPSMMYVALSRVRSHTGLRVCGSPKLLASRTNVLGEVLQWL